MPRTKQSKKSDELVANDEVRLKLLASTVSRATLARYLQSYEGNRDLYSALGYITEGELQYRHFLARYLRQDIAQRIIDAPVGASWRGIPKIVDGDGNEDNAAKKTKFEEAWEKLVRNSKLKLYKTLQDLDRFTGLGQFGVLVIGYKGDAKLDQPVTKRQGREIAYLRAYGEGSVTIGSYETNPNTERFRMPLKYTLNPTQEANDNTPSVRTPTNIHFSRILHVVDGLTESPTHGYSRLKPIYNRLMDLEKVAGGSAEMYWRGARPGMQFDMDADSMMTTETKEALRAQIDEYENNLRRILRTQGITINELKPQSIDPEKFIDAQMVLISGATGIPKRILTGTERGELASTQDAHNWNTTVQERRTDFCEPQILRPFIDMLIDSGALPEPKEGYYTVEWPDLFAPSEKEQAEVAKTRAEALMMYSNSLTGENIIPPEQFMELIMGFEGSKLQKIIDAVKEQEAELEAMEEDERIIAEALMGDPQNPAAAGIQQPPVTEQPDSSDDNLRREEE